MTVTENIHARTVTVSGNCGITGKPYSVTVREDGYAEWKNGAHIQNAMPEVSADDREFLISGTSPDGWKQLFGNDPDGDDEDFVDDE